jgi:homoserine O-acetyltransferase
MTDILRLQEPLTTESGHTFVELDVAYTTFGKLNADKSNVVWICHAFSANSNPEEWWPGMVGKGKYFTPEKYYIVCVNMLGSCYGTTGPLSINPTTSEAYFKKFPVITVRDMVKTLIVVRKHLNIERIHMALGFSMGGQQLLEWVLHEPSVFDNILLGATNIKHSPWGIAFNESQRLAIEADSTYGEPHAEAGAKGMLAARSIGLLSYRNYEAYCKTQGDENDALIDKFKASSYQKYQGEKLVKRFNAYSYWYLSKAMDNHNILRGRNATAEEILSVIKCRTLVLGITSDYLFPLEEQRLLATKIPHARFEIIDSEYGHDGFLIESDKISIILEDFLHNK